MLDFISTNQNNQLYPVWIYALIDPITNAIRYIGKSTDPPRRYSQHLRRNDANPHLWNWIKSLLDKDQKPLMIILHETNNKEWQQHEISYIDKYRSCGEPLTNMESGGGQGYSFTQETKKRMRQAQLRRDPEVNKRISNTLKQYYHDNGGTRTGHKTPDDVREKQRQAKLENPTRAWLGKKRTEQDRKKMSDGRKKYFDRIGRRVDKVVEYLFYNPEMLDMSNRAIARALGDPHSIIGDAREILTGYRSKRK